VPLWGRPSGAKGSRRRTQWEREREQWHEQQGRVEELDSDDTDIQSGVGLISGKKRFSSDPLQFTGIDLSSTSRARRSYTYSTEESSEVDSDGSSFDERSERQVALRDKEEALVQSAFARIRRAQEKGKQEVKLNQDELDALEKRRKRMEAAALAKARKGSGSSGGSGSDKRRRERKAVPIQQLLTEPLRDPVSKKRSKKSSSSTPPSSGSSGPPGILVAGPGGSTLTPLGHYPPQTGHNSPGRPRSSTSQSRGEPFPQLPYQQTTRHYSDGTRPASSSSNSSRRHLPDEEGWNPSQSRRTSVSSQHYTPDPFEFQVSSGQPQSMSQQYLQSPASARRIGSGSAEIAYSSVRRSPPMSGGYPTSGRAPASDPAIRRRSSYRDEVEVMEEDGTSGGDQSDGLDNGIQVYVEKEKEAEREKVIPSRKPVGGSGGKKKGRGR